MARDGELALCDCHKSCVSCGKKPIDLLVEIIGVISQMPAAVDIPPALP